MLFDDDEQLEVRHVISLAHHEISIYSGGDKTPEGELFIKRNALCLSRKADAGDAAADGQSSKPFYLFSENCSAKEDFYFALIRNQEQVFGGAKTAPEPLQFEVKHIISLVQRLHSTEEHMQTRWLNALIGRYFLGIYKTRDVENYIREKITKKIARVKRPAFLSKISINKIDTGDSAPYITNPRLKDLNVEGEFCMEADVKYTGNFRLEVAATIRVDLGTRLKAREVSLVLGVVLKKLDGHIYFKIKPPPSNRLWLSFQTMPKLEMSIEPIVSTRQITYTLILRQIEKQIKEVVAETLVQPFWDDVPFFKTEHKEWRGGIFVGDDAVEHSEDHEELAAMLGVVDEVAQLDDSVVPASPASPDLLPQLDKSFTAPVESSTQNTGFWGRTLGSKKSGQALASPSASASTTALDSKGAATSFSSESPPPKPIRKGSYSISNPTTSADTTHADIFKPSASPPDHDDAASIIATVAARSLKNSSVSTPVGTPTRPASASWVPNDTFSEAQETELQATQKNDQAPPEQAHVPAQAPPLAQGRRNTASSAGSAGSDTHQTSSPALSTKDSQGSLKSGTGSMGRGLFSSATAPTNGTPEPKRTALAAVSNAAATAKRWGWNAMQRRADSGSHGRKISDPPTVDLNQPMGRGQPLPPPGMPLPGPDRRSRVTPIQVPPKRKVAPPPLMPPRKSSTGGNESKSERKDLLPPPLMPRRRRMSEMPDGHDGNEENVFVVEAPAADSEPSTPLVETHEPEEGMPPYMQPWVEDAEELHSSGGDSTPGGETVSVKAARTSQLSSREGYTASGTASGGTSEHSSTSGNSSRSNLHQAVVAVDAEDEDDGYSNWLGDNPEFAGYDGNDGTESPSRLEGGRATPAVPATTAPRITTR
jgi:hypothetical protein